MSDRNPDGDGGGDSAGDGGHDSDGDDDSGAAQGAAGPETNAMPALPGKDLRCPFCHDQVRAEDSQGECVECRAVLHTACFEEHGGCAILGCQCRTLRLPDDRLVMWLNNELVPAEPDAREESSGCGLILIGSVVLYIPALVGVWLMQLDPEVSIVGGILMVFPILFLVAIAMDFGGQNVEEQRRQLQERLDQEEGVTVGSPSMWHDIMGQSGFDPIFGTGGPPRLPRSFIENAHRIRGAFSEDPEALGEDEGEDEDEVAEFSDRGEAGGRTPEASPERFEIKAVELRPEDQRVEDGTD